MYVCMQFLTLAPGRMELFKMAPSILMLGFVIYMARGLTKQMGGGIGGKSVSCIEIIQERLL